MERKARKGNKKTQMSVKFCLRNHSSDETWVDEQEVEKRRLRCRREFANVHTRERISVVCVVLALANGPVTRHLDNDNDNSHDYVDDNKDENDEDGDDDDDEYDNDDDNDDDYLSLLESVCVKAMEDDDSVITEAEIRLSSIRCNP
ncbi:probable DNA-directed RNA polymerase subunit delta [Chelonus insularis]|uniref:probable DNA-directed RNA polymerase subunit delta n=1 Tax=Chelonus insularis TaxID=460826 RepID=UPI00158844A3|nr:probable DNA-directed RNA polymerase subunit delta [Chelonus insularis]